MKRGLVKVLSRTIRKLGYDVKVSKPEKEPIKDEGRGKLNLNVGAGSYVLSGFDSLDIYTPHYYPSKEDFLKERVEYDIRTDPLPYMHETVDNIYINQVVEHVETEHVIRFFEESLRVLKIGGVLRIGCPDAQFLYEVSQFENGYWTWREKWMTQNTFDSPHTTPQFDEMIGMLATQRLHNHINSVPELRITSDDSKHQSYAELMASLKEGCVFRSEHPGDHINNWDFERISTLAESVGFRHCIRSKPQGSISADMQGPKFDKNHNEMSLYVDLMK